MEELAERAVPNVKEAEDGSEAKIGTAGDGKPDLRRGSAILRPMAKMSAFPLRCSKTASTLRRILLLNEPQREELLARATTATFFCGFLSSAGIWAEANESMVVRAAERVSRKMEIRVDS